MNDIQDDRLKEIASTLPSVVLQSRQDGTTRTYASGYQKWKSWASKFDEICHLPADPKYVAIYLLSVMQESQTCSPVNNAFYSISWAHKMPGLEDPTSHELPKRVEESASRSLGHGKK